MNKNTVPNIWKAQEKTLHLYKLMAIGLGIIMFIMLISMIVTSFRNPVVVVQRGVKHEFYPSDRAKASVNKEDVDEFTREFLESLYVWNEFNPEKLSLELSPFAVSDLVTKAVNGQSQKYVKELKNKKIVQAITFVNVDVQADKVVASFDRVLKIEGIPLIIPTVVTLNMIQGTQTRLNPMGIYVSGITEAENAK